LGVRRPPPANEGEDAKGVTGVRGGKMQRVWVLEGDIMEWNGWTPIMCQNLFVGLTHYWCNEIKTREPEKRILRRPKKQCS
jgi:hypothetical protein